MNRLSLYLLSVSLNSTSHFVPLTLCRVNKFFFYSTHQKKLFVDILEAALIHKIRQYAGDKNALNKRLKKIDEWLTMRSSEETGIGNCFLFGEPPKTRGPPKPPPLPIPTTDRDDIDSARANKPAKKSQSKSKKKKVDDEKDTKTLKKKKVKLDEPDKKDAKKKSPSKSKSKDPKKKAGASSSRKQVPLDGEEVGASPAGSEDEADAGTHNAEGEEEQDETEEFYVFDNPDAEEGSLKQSNDKRPLETVN